VYVCICI